MSFFCWKTTANLNTNTENIYASNAFFLIFEEEFGDLWRPYHNHVIFFISFEMKEYANKVEHAHNASMIVNYSLLN